MRSKSKPTTANKDKPTKTGEQSSAPLNNTDAAPKSKKKLILHCSFCGKSQDEITKLIAGPRVFICNECIAICNEIIADDECEKNDRIAQEKFQPGLACVVCALCHLLTPITECLHIIGRARICAPCVGEIKPAIVSFTGRPSAKTKDQLRQSENPRSRV